MISTDELVTDKLENGEYGYAVALIIAKILGKLTALAIKVTVITITVVLCLRVMNVL